MSIWRATYPVCLRFPGFLYNSLLCRVFCQGSFWEDLETISSSSLPQLFSSTWHGSPPPSCLLVTIAAWFCSLLVQRGARSSVMYPLVFLFLLVFYYKRLLHITQMKSSLVQGWDLPYGRGHVTVNTYLKGTEILCT